MLRPEHLDLVEATAPVLAEHGEAIIRHFYPRMFAARPDVAALFSATHQRDGKQQRALADAVLAYAANIRHLERLGPAVERIGHKHASLGILPEHYPIVGEHLLASIREVLGAAATDEILAAWGAAYGLLADVLIQREANLYEAQSSQYGWSGFKSLLVQRKIAESATITSFVLADPEGRELGRALPGQYLTVRITRPDGTTAMRNYSLSSWGDGATFRISVKREDAPTADVPSGEVSTFLHDQVRVGDRLEVAPPAGDFYLEPDATTDAVTAAPLVLLSGGVGVTPLLAMLTFAAETGLARDIVFVHGARDATTHAFSQEVRELAKKHGRTRVHVRYSECAGPDCDSTGCVDAELLRSLLSSTALTRCEAYLCGPLPFMSAAQAALLEVGVPAAHIRYESFGPLEELAAPVGATQ